MQGRNPQTNDLWRRESPKSSRPLREHLVRAAVLELCAAVRLDHELADLALSRLLKREKNLFSAERRAVGEDLFTLLRRERLIDFALGLEGVPQDSKMQMALPQQSRALFAARYAALKILQGEGTAEEIIERHGMRGPWAGFLRRLNASFPGESLPVTQRVAIIGSIPDGLAERLVSDLGETDALGFTFSLLERAPLSIRANALKITRDELRKRLRRSGVETTPTLRAPCGLTARGFPRLTDLREFDDGLFEIQDEGSQLLALLAGAKPGEIVADTCAGAGGKTLALAAQMEGRGELWALDANAGRLKNLARRRVRAAPNALIRTQVIPEEFDAARDAPKLRGRCGCVLIDAPCSGTGVLRRSPDAKSRFEAPDMIADFARRQADILSRHSALVRPGGRLVYATCSVLKAEDEDVVQSFLSAHPDFRLLDAAGCLPEAASPLVRGGFLRTLPHKDGCDGFFGAVMERID